MPQQEDTAFREVKFFSIISFCPQLLTLEISIFAVKRPTVESTDTISKTQFKNEGTIDVLRLETSRWTFGLIQKKFYLYLDFGSWLLLVSHHHDKPSFLIPDSLSL